jgi:transposase-like protein
MLDFDDVEGTPGQPWVHPKHRFAPEMDHEAGAKPSAFSWAMGRLILVRIQYGETVREIAADEAMPSYATIYHWTHRIPEFGRLWRALRAQMAAEARDVDEQRAVARGWRIPHERRLAGKPPRNWKSGRRSTYTEAWADAVCEQIAEGAAISEVARMPGMPSLKAMYRWLRNEEAFRKDYALACQVRTEKLMDLELEVLERCTEATVDRAKRDIARLRGRAGRMAPRKYRRA